MVVSQDTLSYADVCDLLRSGVVVATSRGLNVAIAIADTHGELMGFISMDGILSASRDMAIAKAWTAGSFQRDTSELSDLNLPATMSNAYPGQFVSIGGGATLRHNGRVVGAIGVSGGSITDDIAVASEVAAQWSIESID